MGRPGAADWRAVVAGLLLALSLSACPAGPTIECCATDSDCEQSQVCEDCSCIAACTSHDDCSGTTPNCNTASGRCGPPCLLSDECYDPTQPVCDPQAGLCRPPCPGWPCSALQPNCQEATGVCLGPCPGTDCELLGLANCAGNGVCYDACTSPTDCPDPAAPNCDPATGTCFGACTRALDCEPAVPNCDTATGLCSAPCPGTACPGSAPNCDPSTGLCGAPCRSAGDCRDPAQPNCGADGVCFAPCSAHADCTNAERPSCDLDPASATYGQCRPACSGAIDCTAAFPRCEAGRCEAGCTSDAACTAPRTCHLPSGQCVPPSCTVDADCAPPAMVCEGSTCVPGCRTNRECSASDRCRLTGTPYHCEPRDCLNDAGCSPPTSVCDTDGGGDPAAGGYCVAGCEDTYDCPAGYDCTPGNGRCVTVDYGDVGVSCSGACTGCQSGLGVDLTAGGRACTRQCCQQADCPGGWACRPVPDGDAACPDCRIRICVPLEDGNLGKRATKSCAGDWECRSQLCEESVCTETCCEDGDCPGARCFARGANVLACATGAPATDLGALGCGTPPASPTITCQSQLCFNLVSLDESCASEQNCPANANAWCGDYDREQDANDCVYDFCTDHCCTTSDCTGSVTGRRYFCGKRLFGGTGDLSVCLLAPDTATGAPGTACTANAQCASGFCSTVSGVCRERCCTDADCGGMRCRLETNDVYGTSRRVSLCVP